MDKFLVISIICKMEVSGRLTKSLTNLHQYIFYNNGFIEGYKVMIEFNVGKSNNTQGKSLAVTIFYDRSKNDQDILLLLNDDCEFLVDDIRKMMKDKKEVMTRENKNTIYFNKKKGKLVKYSDCSILLIKKNILNKILEKLKKDFHDEYKIDNIRFSVSGSDILPFFIQKFVNKEWLDEDQGFCHMVYEAGGQIFAL